MFGPLKKNMSQFVFTPRALARWGKHVFQSKFSLNKLTLFELSALPSFDTSKNVTYTVWITSTEKI